ncbi:MAG: metallophosphoesterase, partial [Verrucomicrobiales bacterium]|nr:metallophosphoesterase [Verrucomicrobiales bacterium]
MNPATRRTFLRTTAAAGLLAGASGCATASASRRAAMRGAFSADTTVVRCYSPAIEKPVRIHFVPDTHLWRDDERGEPFRPYSARMAKAYNVTRQFRTAEPTNPEDAYVATLKIAKDAGTDLVVLGGDLFSFPSEAAIEWALSRLAETGLPYAYVAGNHDWHYEGMEGTSDRLRETWIQRRLRPVYGGAHPLMAARDVGGVRLVLLDNSTYEIHPEQLEFFRAQARFGLPIVLCVHIPLYVPGRPVGFGCGHPEWGAKTDRGFELERRPPWRETGHTACTMEFHRTVFSTPNLLGIFAGHIHRPSTDYHRGIPQ